MPKPKFKTQFEGQTRVQTHFDLEKTPSLTEQSHKQSCDVNCIIKRLAQTGIPDPGFSEQNYGEFDPVDFQDAMNTIAKGQSSYEQLPAAIKQKFGSPHQYMEFVTNPDNAKKMVELGIAVKRENENPQAPVDITELKAALRTALKEEPKTPPKEADAS